MGDIEVTSSCSDINNSLDDNFAAVVDNLIDPGIHSPLKIPISISVVSSPSSLYYQEPIFPSAPASAANSPLAPPDYITPFSLIQRPKAFRRLIMNSTTTGDCSTTAAATVTPPPPNLNNNDRTISPIDLGSQHVQAVNVEKTQVLHQLYQLRQEQNDQRDTLTFIIGMERELFNARTEHAVAQQIVEHRAKQIQIVSTFLTLQQTLENSPKGILQYLQPMPPPPSVENEKGDDVRKRTRSQAQM